MKLYLRRDNANEGSRFIVCDDKGKLKYFVKGRRGCATDRMVITDIEGHPLLTLRAVVFHSFYVFSVRGSRENFVITLTGMPRKPEFKFHGITWRVSDFLPDRSFSVIDIDNSGVMRQSNIKNNYYELFIESEHRELLCVATAICADIVNYLTLIDVVPV